MIARGLHIRSSSPCSRVRPPPVTPHIIRGRLGLEGNRAEIVEVEVDLVKLDGDLIEKPDQRLV